MKWLALTALIATLASCANMGSSGSSTDAGNSPPHSTNDNMMYQGGN